MQYGSIFNRTYTRAPAWDQWDARLSFTARNGGYTLAVWGKNLLDDLGYEGGAVASRRTGFLGPATAGGMVNTPVNQGIATSYPLTPPRTFGVEIQKRFF